LPEWPIARAGHDRVVRFPYATVMAAAALMPGDAQGVDLFRE